jgi:biotin operon repressor
MVTPAAVRPGRAPGRRGHLAALENTPVIDWSLLSAQGKVLFYIALCPVCSVQEIAVALGLTERAVWGIIRTLRRDGMLILDKRRRRHRYSVNLDARLLHPTISGLTLRPVLQDIAEHAAENPNENCVRIA